MNTLNRNSFLLLLILITSAISLNAQTKVIKKPNLPKVENSISEYISVDTILSFIDEIPINNSLINCTWKDELVFTNFNIRKNSDTITIYRINITTANIDTFYIYENGIRNTLKTNQCTALNAIAYNGRQIVINLHNKIYIYELNNSQIPNKITEQTIQKSFCDMDFLNDSTLVFIQNNHSSKPKTAIYLYNIPTKQITNEMFPRFNTTLLSYFKPAKFYDIKNNKILWANRNTYSFLLFDENLTKITTLSRIGDNWKSLSDKIKKKASKIKRTNAPEIIHCIEKEFGKTDQLRFAHIIDSNHIALVIHRANENMVYIDVWQQDNNEWKEKYNKLYDDGFVFNPDKVIHRNNIPLGYLAGDDVHIFNNKAVSVTKRGTVKNPIGLEVRDYFLQKDNYLKTNDYFIQVIIYSHSLTD